MTLVPMLPRGNREPAVPRPDFMPPFDISPLARKIVLAALAVLHVATVLFVGIAIQKVDHSSENYLLAALGVCSGQASVAAVWMALGPSRLLSRASLALLALALSCLPMLACSLHESELMMAVVFNGLLLTQFVLIQLPLWFLRLWRGRSLCLVGDAPQVETKPTQFGIGQLLVWTAGSAFVLGVARLVMPRDARWVTSGQDIYHVLIVFSLLLVFHTFLPLSIVAAVFARRMPLQWIALALFVAAIGSWLEPWLFEAFLAQRGAGDEGQFFWLNGPHVAWLLGNLIVLRICGYRLS